MLSRMREVQIRDPVPVLRLPSTQKPLDSAAADASALDDIITEMLVDITLDRKVLCSFYDGFPPACLAYNICVTVASVPSCVMCYC